MGIRGGRENVLNNNSWGLEQMGGWKIEHMDIATDYLGRLTNHELSIQSKVKKIIDVENYSFWLVSK